MYEYFKCKIEKTEIRLPLINEINNYVNKIIKKDIPRINYDTYKNFYKLGIRKEFEDLYFERRKQLSAIGLYLQWNTSEKILEYFQELLWEISNEFSWCLAAHLSYDENGFKGDSEKIIDLFSAETAQTLSELLIIHADKIDTILSNHIKNQIRNRVITPFLNNVWEWETAKHNWSAVCGSCLGIVGLLMEKGDVQEKILEKVDRALEYYISGFGEDGITLEGISYWTYGFGYYIYYQEMREKLTNSNNQYSEKIKKICNMPESIQISEGRFLPFSDVPQIMEVPSGLISYLYKRFKINLPKISKITSFEFDNCYRWAHLSRNLWWTSNEIIDNELKDKSIYFSDAQWLIYRKNMFLAIKCGSNNEPHNHNDVGNLVIALNGELILTDLGAGLYTAGYFGSERYTYDHTRSYWHSVPIVNGYEQTENDLKNEVIKNNVTEEKVEFKIEISNAYQSNQIDSLYREIQLDDNKDEFILEDSFKFKHCKSINEGFISTIKPVKISENEVIWTGVNGNLILNYDNKNLKCFIESKMTNDHYGNKITIYRLGLSILNITEEFKTIFKFRYFYDLD